MSQTLGVMAVQNEWPLCGVSISYALDNHVDRIVVIDHNGEDETLFGLAHLQGLYAERLAVVRVEAQVWDQASIYELGILVLDPEPEDWIYLFDADEFLLVSSGESLREVLDELESDVVSYAVENWLVPNDMDLSNLDAYLRITTRSLPTKGHEVTHEQMEELEDLKSNYFDYTFQPKLINRLRAGQRYSEGAHALYKGTTSEKNLGVAQERFYAVHLPFASWDRLVMRAQRGQEVIASRVDRNFGWQSQMVARLRATGKLATFWETHAVCEPSIEIEALATAYDMSFQTSVAPTINRLRAYFGDNLNSSTRSHAPRFALDVKFATQMYERFTHLRSYASSLDVSRQTEVSRISKEYEAVITSILDSRTWKIGLRLQKLAQFLRGQRRG
ncbi:MAG: glycosyltransferase family 2 protein [Actinomycetota bacterium]